MTNCYLELNNICKSYFSESGVTQALHRVSAHFSAGEFVAVTGESGSGKSTLLGIIGGLLSFDEGEMIYNGNNFSEFTDEELENYKLNDVAYVYQNYGLIEHYSCIDNIIAALKLIRHSEEADLKKEAISYLKETGLYELRNRKACMLSSGQRQRLSIARALSEKANIILFDEPTGNLDDNTGKQILELIKRLSEKSLVIMVTHNIEQAEPYITRKIRINEGILVSDISVREAQTLECTEMPKDEKPLSGIKRSIKSFLRDSFFFAFKNCTTRLSHSFLYTVFLFILLGAAFVLTGELCLQADDIKTKRYSDKVFYNECDTRIVVKHFDGTGFDENELHKIMSLNHVIQVDSCDISNDINFYIEEGRDYKINFGRFFRNYKGTTTYEFLNEEHFVHSVDFLNEDMLSFGRMPEAVNEIVVYGDESMLGNEKTCYFTANNIWDQGQYYSCRMIIVGILKDETEQVFFTRKFCNMLSSATSNEVLRICYAYNKDKGDYEQKPALIPVINKELEGNNVKVSSKIDMPISGKVLMTYRYFDENGKAIGDELEDEIIVLKETSPVTSDFLEVSEELYDRYVNFESNQASVYIDSYANTDKVLKALEKSGYKALSTLRVSTSEYIGSKVNERLTVILISSGGLLVLVFCGVVVLSLFLKIKTKEALIMNSLGFNKAMHYLTSFIELTFYLLISGGLLFICAFFLKSRIKFINDIITYYRPAGYVLLVFIMLLIISLSCYIFTACLRKKSKGGRV